MRDPTALAERAVSDRARLRHWRRTRVAASGFVPTSTPPAQSATTAIWGAVEVTGGQVIGWAHGPDRTRPMAIAVVAGAEEIGHGITDRPRIDLGGPHGFVVACRRVVAAWEVALGQVQVRAVPVSGPAQPLPLAPPILAAAVQELVRTATGTLGEAALDTLLAALNDHPLLVRRRAAARLVLQQASRAATAAAVQQRLAGLPLRPAPAGAVEPDWPVSLPAGHLSPDGSALVGHGGHVYLVEGSNGLLDQYLGPADTPAMADKAAAWRALIAARAATCTRLGARFLQVMIPEKISVLPDHLPRDIAVPTPLWRAIEAAFQADPPGAGQQLSALPVLAGRGLRELAFPRIDTHLSARGAYAVFVAICAAMQVGRPFPEAPFTRSTEEIGDLAERLAPGVRLPETYHWPMAELVAIWPTPSLVEEFDPGRHTGRRLVWRTPDAPVRARVIAFGNSYFERGGSPRALSWWCARAFTEFHFCWSAEMDEDYIRAQNPDWVICQTIERFLPQLPAR